MTDDMQGFTAARLAWRIRVAGTVSGSEDMPDFAVRMHCSVKTPHPGIAFSLPSPSP